MRLYPLAGLHQYDWKENSEATGLDTGRESPVQQSFAEEMDINTIVRRFGLTNEMPFGRAAGVYADFTGISDYDDAAALIARTDEQFMMLPPEVREYFGNDPARLVRQVSDMSQEEWNALFPAAPADDGSAGGGS